MNPRPNPSFPKRGETWIEIVETDDDDGTMDGDEVLIWAICGGRVAYETVNPPSAQGESGRFIMAVDGFRRNYYPKPVVVDEVGIAVDSGRRIIMRPGVSATHSIVLTSDGALDLRKL